MSSDTDNQQSPELFAAKSVVGNVREHNEDSYVAAPPLFVVADGMGGHEAGEVASAIAVDSMVAAELDAPDEEALARAVEQANQAVLRGAEDGTGKPGMGTTMTAALVFGDETIIAQVGDSRAYLLHNGSIHQLTRDHSLVADLVEQGTITAEEARFHPQRSVITRALGSDPNMEPDLYTLRVEEGDRLLLCSDGLSSMITDDSIAAILATNPSPQDACDALVREALAAGGLDNVTVIVIDPLRKDAAKRPDPGAASADETVAIAPEASPAARPFATPEGAAQAKPQANMATAQKRAEKKARRKGRRGPVIWVIAFLLIIAAACGGFYAYAQSSYYLISEDGYVTVYRGVPGEFAGQKLHWLEQKTDIQADKLNPTVASRLHDGISVDSLDRANQFIAEYHEQLGDGEATDAGSASSDSTASSTESGE